MARVEPVKVERRSHMPVAFRLPGVLARGASRVPARPIASPSLLAGLTVVLLGALVLSLGMGAVSMTPGQVLAALAAKATGAAATSPQDLIIIWDLRLARGLLAIVVGAGLATAGTAYQAVFRNPLADPFVIGASGGAALGATLAIVARLPAVLAAAFAGAVVAVVLVYVLAQGGGRPSAVNLLLAGAALSTLLSSLVSLVMFLSDRNLQEIFGWLMGGLSGRSWVHLTVAAPVIAASMVVLWLLARPLDALTLGEESAQSLGLNLTRARLAIITAATLATAAAVAACGIIGFVGLIVPHVARRLAGGGHSRLIPLSAVMGGLLVLLADDLARTVMAPVELPAGILMALIGAPFFLWLLKRG